MTSGDPSDREKASMVKRFMRPGNGRIDRDSQEAFLICNLTNVNAVFKHISLLFCVQIGNDV